MCGCACLGDVVRARAEYAWLRVARLSLAGARRACQRVGFTCDAGSGRGPGWLAAAGPVGWLMREWGGFFAGATCCLRRPPLSRPPLGVQILLALSRLGAGSSQTSR